MAARSNESVGRPNRRPAPAAVPPAPVVVTPGAERALLEPLPLAALRLSPEIVAGLDRVGLKTVGAILDLPRAPLARRFGLDVARRLDQALGREDEPIAPRRPVPALVAERRFAEPILAEGDVAQVIRSLAAHLAGPLEARGEGARALELALFRVDGAVTRLFVGASRPLRDPALVLGLFAEKLRRIGDDLDFGFGFETVRLAVTQSAPDDPAQIDMTGSAEAREDLARLVDRLGARLGVGRIRRALPEETHIPEAASLLVPAVEAGGRAEAAWIAEARPDAAEPIERPIRLLARPEPIEAVAEVPEGPPIRFRWRRAIYDIARFEGPERIAAEWWRHVLPDRQAPRAEDPHPDDLPRSAPKPRPVPLPAGMEAPANDGAPGKQSIPRHERSPSPSPLAGEGAGGERTGDGRAPRPATMPAPPSPEADSWLEQTMDTTPLPPRTPGLTRDYFRVEDREGRRFWVFREGLYERETGRPRWFLQGIFA